MPNVIKPKRSAVAGNIPTTSQISQYEIAMNTADKKIFTSNGTDIIQLSSGTIAGLSDVNLASLTNGQVLSYDSASGKWINSTSSGGGGGPVASGAIYENSQTITADYTITSGKNAMSAGPITIQTGASVTIPSGSTWVIV